jgi:hypothetical protein
MNFGYLYALAARQGWIFDVITRYKELATSRNEYTCFMGEGICFVLDRKLEDRRFADGTNRSCGRQLGLEMA